MKIKPEPILDETVLNFQTELEKYLIQDSTASSQKTGADKGSEYVTPMVPRHIARYLYRRSNELNKVVKAYTKDCLLNDFSLADADATDNEIELLNMVWNNNSNKVQLFFGGIEEFIYGYSALEIIGSGKETRFQQIPAHTLQIKVETWAQENGEEYQFFYAEQEINGQKILFRLAHLDYTLLDKYNGGDESVGTCIWFGGCNENEFFDIPGWESCSEDIFTVLAIKNMNMKKMRRGNIPAGILMFQGPRALPDPEHPDEPRIDQKLAQELDGTDGGTMFTYLETNSATREITMQYQALTDNNYDYLQQLREDCEKQVLTAYMMPPTRLMRMDQKESMNSEKTEKVFEIYCSEEIPSTQMLFKDKIDQFNRHYLGIKSGVVMNTPEFVDKTNIRVNTIISLFNTGLLTLGQALELLSDIYPEVDVQEEIECDLLEMRFYNGNVLGNNRQEYDNMDKLDTVISNVNNMLSDEGYNPLEI